MSRFLTNIFLTDEVSKNDITIKCGGGIDEALSPKQQAP